jgi:RNA polymerase sigma factor (sigma-70 family)
MSEAPLKVYIVDDDAAVRDSLSLLLSLRGYSTLTFACAEDFLGRVGDDWAGCVIADIRMPGLSGLELQEALAARGISLPVIVITAHGSVEASRRAFKARAVDFLEKPFDEDGPIAAVEAPFAQERRRLESRESQQRRELMLAALTPREREVVDLLIKGMHHTDIGKQLGISPRTVEVHKARIMAKLGIRSATELVRLALGSGD